MTAVIASGAQPMSAANALAVAKQSLEGLQVVWRLPRRYAPRNDVQVSAIGLRIYFYSLKWP